ncbi:MAG TPA: PepSY domain-containing protein [Burkholderiales bacterium]|nr:PepSY domain-containing protein [Burkholderiales bacterium]
MPRIHAASFYAAVWRWHFIAGLLVMPFLCVLAVTGGIYLFSPELDSILYRPFDRVTPSGRAALALDRLVALTQSATNGHVKQVLVTGDPARSVRMTVHTAHEANTVFVDPYEGKVLATVGYGGAMQVVRKLHSLQYFGPKASWLMEIAAGWAMVLATSGIYLWWPRGAKGGVLSVRGPPAKRIFWRDLHAVTGVFASGVILFLAFTGMPWSNVWGGKVQELATEHNMSRPQPPADVVPDWELDHVSSHDAAMSGVPWALEKAPSPPSDLNAGRAKITLDQAVVSAERAGLSKPFSLTLPQGARGAYVATYTPARAQDTRVIYMDQYSGAILDDVSFARFGPAAKAIEWGIAVHQGQEYGAVNRYVMLAGCVSIVLLAITSVTMWWKRRPSGSLGVPPRPPQAAATRVLAAIVVPFAIFFPLVGASLLAAFAVERVWMLAMRRI